MRCPIHGCEMQMEHNPHAFLTTEGRWFCQKCRDKEAFRKAQHAKAKEVAKDGNKATVH